MQKSMLLVLYFFIGLVNAHSQTANFTAEKNGIKLTGVENPKTFMDAKLSLNDSLFLEKDLLDTGKFAFSFDVKNYQLGAQTPDADTRLCANSAKGQHIHFILDNARYQASYASNISASLKVGHHVLLAFLSRSYHESIKHKNAFIVKEFDAGKKGVDQFNAKSPHIFFSRPKGEYNGKKETKKLMLDFYLLNCNLSEKGFKVRATINGTEFLLTKWEPYFIEGLPLGEVKVKLELLDKNGKLVLSPFNGTERIVKLLPDEPGK
jgi:hypothetical protein